MKIEGFDITYLDLSNEQTIIQPHHAKYIKDNLATYLDARVDMPYLIAPSTRSVQGRIDWLASINAANGEQNGIDIASVHNTGGSGSLSQFVNSASGWGQDAWNTEMHGWVGSTTREGRLNSAVFWDLMTAGITGVSPGLFVVSL